MHLAFNRRGDRIVVSHAHDAPVFRVEDGKEAFRLTHPRSNQYATFSNDDRHLVSVSSGGSVHLWDAATGKAVERPLRCADFVRRVGFFPDNCRFFAASLDGTVRVWSLPRPNDLLTPYAFDGGRAHKHVILTPQGSQTFSPDGERVAQFNPTGVEVRPRTGYKDLLYRLSGARWARFTADGRRLITANETEVRSFDAGTGQPLGKSISLDGRIAQREFASLTARISASADGKRLATLDDPRTVSVWDVQQGRLLLGPLRASKFNSFPPIFGSPEERDRIAQPHLTPDGQVLVLGVPSSGILAAWDITSGRALYQLKRYSGYLFDLAISEDGRSMLAVSSDNKARLYETRTGLPLGPSLVHTGTAVSGDIAGDGVRVVTREKSTARIWDARSGDLLVRFPSVPSDVEPLWFSRDGKRVMMSGRETAYAWQLARLEMPAEQVPDLVGLLTAGDIDGANGLTQLDQDAFLMDPARYRKAWLTWSGATDDPAAQP
jgi:WD40 repeat protein